MVASASLMTEVCYAEAYWTQELSQEYRSRLRSLCQPAAAVTAVLTTTTGSQAACLYLTSPPHA